VLGEDPTLFRDVPSVLIVPRQKLPVELTVTEVRTEAEEPRKHAQRLGPDRKVDGACRAHPSSLASWRPTRVENLARATPTP